MKISLKEMRVGDVIIHQHGWISEWWLIIEIGQDGFKFIDFHYFYDLYVEWYGYHQFDNIDDEFFRVN